MVTRVYNQANLENRQVDEMNAKNFKTQLDKIAGKVDSLEYEFYDPTNEDAALEITVLLLTCLDELQSITERDEAFKNFKKND